MPDTSDSGFTYQRGHIRVLDRAGLEKFARECYPVVKEKFDEFVL